MVSQFGESKKERAEACCYLSYWDYFDFSLVRALVLHSASDCGFEQLQRLFFGIENYCKQL
jgi:hypothetical protein